MFDTRVGRCVLVWSERGVLALRFASSDASTKASLAAQWPGARESKPVGFAREAIKAVAGHLSGQSKADSMMAISLDMSGISEFPRRVYEALRLVPSGATVTYGDLGAQVGNARAARAVGQAVGRNPFAVIVPCHRVVAAGGRLGGFSAPGGVATKRAILRIEGAPVVGGLGDSGLAFDPDEAASHLCRVDSTLARVIDRSGPVSLRVEKLGSPFEALARSIVYQQLAGKAAAAIYGRMCELFPRRKPTARAILELDDSVLRGAGLSRNKTAAMRDLAQRVLDGTIPSLRSMREMTDDQIIERLTKVRGIGRWTVEMLLIFRLGRPDVLPVGDYGIRKGFQLTYASTKLPTPRELAAHGNAWRPFRTAASWYLWRAVDLARA
jgi:methylated-DNA-[protein]-cysteine S-methyltransferase